MKDSVGQAEILDEGVVVRFVLWGFVSLFMYLRRGGQEEASTLCSWRGEMA